MNRFDFLTTPLNALLPPQKQQGSVLVLTIALMLLFSGQILMVGMVTTKSLSESGALGAFSIAAREEAFGAMTDFETKELYPAYMRMATVARANLATVTPISGQELWNNYNPNGANAVFRTDAVNNLGQRNWSAYRQQLWDPVANAYVNGPFTTNVWFESSILPGPSGTLEDGYYEWPFTIVAHVRGNGVDQVLRRQTTMIPEGFRDF
jgi:hypothetical protein